MSRFRKMPVTAADGSESHLLVPIIPNQLSGELLDWAIAATEAVLQTPASKRHARAHARITDGLKALDDLYLETYDRPTQPEPGLST